MKQIKPLSMTLYGLLLLVAACFAFVLEVWCFPKEIDGLTTNVILLITAIVFLLQWREAFETRRLLLEQSYERDRPKLSIQLVPDMRNGDTGFAIVNQGTRDVEARVTLALSWVQSGRNFESFGRGLHGGEESWIVHFGESKSGHFRLVELSYNPRGGDQKDIVPYLTGRRESNLSLTVRVKARNLESATDDWERMPAHNWILRPDERTWVADHKLRT